MVTEDDDNASNDSDGDNDDKGMKRKRNKKEVYKIKQKKIYFSSDENMSAEEAERLWFKEQLESLRTAARYVDSYESSENFDVTNK